jgi:NAD(P)-dependent dehydrogenase (short-subunit alcohol dehydrogenase family)
VKILEGQVALITGGGRGIGACLANAFARQGARLVLVARTAREVKLTAAACQALGTEALGLTADVSNAEHIRRAVRTAEKQFGRVDILVNAAGVYGPIGPLVQNDLAAWAEAVSVNLLGTVYALHAVLPGMISRGHGVVINFSGGGAVTPFPRFSAYSASKAAVVRLTETVAEEMRDSGIRINAIAPGAVNTRLLEEVLSAGERAGRDFYRKAVAQKTDGGTPPERAAELAVFLASPAAARITGRLLSAIWDDWRKLSAEPASLEGSALYTMRRIDGRNFHEAPRPEPAKTRTAEAR